MCFNVHVQLLFVQYERSFPEDEDGGHLIALGSNDSEAQIDTLFSGESGMYSVQKLYLQYNCMCMCVCVTCVCVCVCVYSTTTSFEGI